MASTRRAAPLQIFQDPANALDEFQFEPDMLRIATALRASTDDHMNADIVLAPSDTGEIAYSPAKRQSPQTSPQPQMPRLDSFHAVCFPPPDAVNFVTESPSKAAAYPSSLQSFAEDPRQTYVVKFPAPSTLDKENVYPSGMSDDNVLNRTDSVFTEYWPAVDKHSFSAAAPLRDRGHKRQKFEEDESVVIPEPEDMPALTDDGTKPFYSYATLIGMAILRAPHRRLTLAQIYKWISDTFTYYQAAEPGWMNSIRHNLSLNKAFVKKERPKDDPGKGNYWAIEKGMEKQFLKDKPVRRPATAEANYFQTIYSDGLGSSAAPAIGAFALPPKPARIVDSSRFPGENELSSDATIPELDPNVRYDDQEEYPMPPPQPQLMLSSPPIHSSPPLRKPLPPTGTPPPPVPRFPTLSRSGGRRKRTADFRDSGFFSSIGSSASRGYQNDSAQSALVADLDRSLPKPVIHGRAEEEIVRIRGSSFDPSPTKIKSLYKKSESSLTSSSPLGLTEDLRLLPSTPAIKLKPPTRAPPTASPNTHLRRHRDSVRELVGTPANGPTPPTDQVIWTPAFTIHDEENENVLTSASSSNHSDSAIFDKVAANVFKNYDTGFATGSPMKQSAKIPMLHHAIPANAILSDLTGAEQNARLASPIRMASARNALMTLESPTRKSIFGGNSLTPKTYELDASDLWAVSFGSDDENDDVIAGLDLATDFRQIGEGKRTTPDLSTKRPMRPTLGRNVTNIF